MKRANPPGGPERSGEEEPLPEAGEKYRAFFDESPVGMSMTAPDGRLLRVNRALCTALGYSMEELSSLDFAAVTHPDDAAETWAAVRSLLAGEGATWSAEKRYVRKDGSVFWAAITSSLMRDRQGRPVCFMTHIQDISERRKAQELTRVSEERFRNAFLYSPDVVGFSRLEDGRYVFVNLSFSRILGYASEEVLGRTSLELDLWESPLDRHRLVGALKAEGRTENMEVRLRCKDGSVRLGLMSAIVVDLAGVPHILNIVRDITGLRAMEEQAQAVRTERIRMLEEADRSRRALLSLVEDQARTEAALRQSETRYRDLNAELERRVQERTAQLEASNRELEAFSYSVSHDLRAPLRAIDGFSGIVADRHGTQLDAEGRRLLGIVRANALKMARLIDDLLAFSRSGRSAMRYGLLDMREIVRASFLEVVPDAGKRARIDFEVDDIPAVDGDLALIGMVWVNLLSNAVKFSSGKERPVIRVEGETDGRTAVYRVRDDGVGFDMAFSGKLFGVFQRLHGVTEFEGTGVGLALVQRIVHRHGGRVWGRGAVGEGATFSFELPVSRTEAAAE